MQNNYTSPLLILPHIIHTSDVESSVIT